MRWALEDLRLQYEQRRSVLGPAHLRWQDHSVAENQERWANWDWSRRGEEWNVSDDWKASLIDEVLKQWIPVGGVVVEIGPGGGRWSEALVPRSSQLILVDVSDRALELCRARFAAARNVTYKLTSGSTVSEIATRSVDAVWSFDVFVHIAPGDQAAYLSEISRILVSGGVAVIHHADGRNRGRVPSRHGWRSPMSRRLFATLAAGSGLEVEGHVDSWGPDSRHDLGTYGDVITILRKRR